MAFTSDNPLQSNQVPISIDFPNNSPDDLPIALEQSYKRIVSSLNTKEGAFYLLLEQATFKQWYVRNNPLLNRYAYRKVFDLVALNGGNIAGGATVSFPHNIIGLKNTVFVYVDCASTVPEFFTAIDYGHAKANATNIIFTNPSPDALTQADFIFEYLKVSN